MAEVSVVLFTRAAFAGSDHADRNPETVGKAGGGVSARCKSGLGERGRWHA
jgi:hypothetical protein